VTLARTGDLIADAAAAGRAVAAFNVITLEHAEAIATAAERAGVPVLLQISQNAVAYHGRLAPIARACREVADASSAPIALHLDHVTDEALLHQAVDTGITSVMFDASKLGYEANVAATRSAGRWAHDHGLWFEAELGEVGGKDGAHAPGVRTDPTQAVTFVERTNADGLAVAVGSSHAMTRQEARLDIDLISRLTAAVPAPLVLHGSSGVPDDQLAAAVVAGIVKVNVGTALNASFTRAVRRALDDTRLVDPRAYLALARDEMTDCVEHLLRVLAPAKPVTSAR
jgi:fructose-bisphosphate aldolase class II